MKPSIFRLFLILILILHNCAFSTQVCKGEEGGLPEAILHEPRHRLQPGKAQTDKTSSVISNSRVYFEQFPLILAKFAVIFALNRGFVCFLLWLDSA